MRLSEFITTHLDDILSDWVDFARSRAPAGSGLDVSKLRDHAATMLCEIARDLETSQPAREETARSKGLVDTAAPDAEAAAEEHGAGRAEYGFTLSQMVSEFAALRSAVINLWKPDQSTITATDFDDLKRFDEAIDQTRTASASRYMQELDHAKETFLGILGHDLKTPLSAVIMSARFMLESNELSPSHRAMAERIERSGQRMHQMVSDLLDFTRSRLGSGIPITRVDTDLEKVVREAVDEIAASHRDRCVEVEATGDLRGQWDPRRVGQALTNLISNAVQHGAQDAHTAVTARGEPEAVIIAVHNEGQPMSGEKLAQLFDPLARLSPTDARVHDPNHLGLGLHIAKAIVIAHGGRIDVESSAEHGTTFTMRLPRTS